MSSELANECPSWQCPFPIFTVQLPGQKLYVIKSMDLIQSAQKQPKVLSFTPIEAEFAIKMCGTSKAANEIIMRNLNGEEGDWGLSMEIYDGKNRFLVDFLSLS